MKTLLAILTILLAGLLLKAETDIESPIKVSIISLIANPEKYKNTTVEVYGYYSADEDEDACYIYLTKEYASLNDKTNAIILSEKSYGKAKGNPPGELYVRVMGVVDNFDDTESKSKKAYIRKVHQITWYVVGSSKGKPTEGMIQQDAEQKKPRR